MDQDEFLQATLRHADVVHALARRLAPDPQDVADIVQETYLRGFAAWGRRPPRDVGAWIATICLNEGRDARRRQARRNAVLSDRPAPDSASRADTAEAALERIGSRRIEAALWELPEPQRVAITLMDVCGFTAGQVAAVTGSPRGTILARVHRGRKRLALTLGDGSGAGAPRASRTEARDDA